MRRFLIQMEQRVLLLALTMAAGLLVLGLRPSPVLFGQMHSGIAQRTMLSTLPVAFSSRFPASTHEENASPVSLSTERNDSGYGAGGSTNRFMQPHQEVQQAAVCNPLDMACLAQAALAAILAPVTQTLTTFCDTVLKNIATALSAPSSTLPVSSGKPASTIGVERKTLVGQEQAAPLSFNFLTQTPLCFSTVYSACAPSALDGAIAPFTSWAQAVATSALALLLVLGGIGISLGQQAGWRVPGVSQLIPRLALTALAAWMAPSIVQICIDLNNLLCQGALQTAQIGTLATQIASLVDPGLPTTNLLVLLFLVAVTFLAILLIGQMGLRLAFVALLGGLASLGLLCFGFPLTTGWGRLWMQQFSLAVFVQFVQVASLALGGALLVALSAPTATLFAGVPDATPLVESLLLIMLFYLAIRLPAMISGYAARHVSSEVTTATMQTLQGAGELLALLVA